MMETDTFTVNSQNVALILNNENFLVNRVFFQVVHSTSNSAGASTGFSDGISKQSRSSLSHSGATTSFDSTSFAITHYKRVGSSNVRKIAGNTTDLSEPGMIYMTFTNYDPSLTIRYFAFED